MVYEVLLLGRNVSAYDLENAVVILERQGQTLLPQVVGYDYFSALLKLEGENGFAQFDGLKESINEQGTLHNPQAHYQHDLVKLHAGLRQLDALPDLVFLTVPFQIFLLLLLFAHVYFAPNRLGAFL